MSDITDAYIRRSLQLLRAAEGDATEVSTRIRKIHDSIIRDVSDHFSGGTFKKKKRFEELRIDIQKALSDFYEDEWPKELKDLEAEVIAKEVEWNHAILAEVTGETVIVPRLAEVAAKAQARPYQGQTFAAHIRDAYGRESGKVSKLLQEGYMSGKNVQEMVRDMSGLLGKADADVRTITRSYFMHNATEAKESVYELNPDLVEAIIWVSTLDARTTPLICGVRDQKLYTVDHEPIGGHGLDWDAGPGRIHWNCRSSSAPKVRGVKDTSSPRAAVGPGSEYKRGDNTTSTGRVRKPHKAAREAGIFKTEMKTTRTQYESWLRAESKKNIDFAADVLGSKEKAKAFRDGKVTLSQLGALSPVANPITRGSL